MTLPLGKLPPDLLARLLERHAGRDPRLVLGPGPGVDCAVIEFGERLLVAKSDPVTFASDEIGWYAVHVNANDIATTGARPRWFLATILLPEAGARAELAEAIFDQIGAACAQLGASLVGGHSEVTAGLDRPIVAGTMLGETTPGRLITPRGARAGDHLLLTKGVPLEGTSLLAREAADQLAGLPPEMLARARRMLHEPGISVVREAMAAAAAGGVRAMHDPTEGGLAAGIWEMAEAAGLRAEIEGTALPVLPEGAAIGAALGLDPLATIASGSLLLAVDPARSEAVRRAIEAEGVPAAEIGVLAEGAGVLRVEAGRRRPWPRPARDEVAVFFERPR